MQQAAYQAGRSEFAGPSEFFQRRPRASSTQRRTAEIAETVEAAKSHIAGDGRSRSRMQNRVALGCTYLARAENKSPAAKACKQDPLRHAPTTFRKSQGQGTGRLLCQSASRWRKLNQTGCRWSYLGNKYDATFQQSRIEPHQEYKKPKNIRTLIQRKCSHRRPKVYLEIIQNSPPLGLRDPGFNPHPEPRSIEGWCGSVML